MELQIREMEIDWLKIIDLSFKRKDWGKTYVLYTCDSTTISCLMKEFNFEQNVAWFKIKYNYFKGNSISTREELIRYYISNFTVEDFKMHLMKKIVNNLNRIILYEKDIEASNKYCNIHYYSWDIKEKDILNSSYSEDFKALTKINSNTLKEECLQNIQSLVTKELNIEFRQCVENHIKNNTLEIPGFKQLINKLSE